jgi:hypothetical protein
MKAHQRIIRERKQSENGNEGLFGAWWSYIDTSFDKAQIHEIANEQAAAVIRDYEWLGDMPQAVTTCWGLLWERTIAGVLVFAEKPGSNLASDKSSIVPQEALYLARGACVHWAPPNAASFFINAVCQKLGNVSVLAYSDPAAGEVGTIYQALGWVYIGKSRGGPTGVLVDGKLMQLHSFKRDRNYNVGQSLAEVRAAFPKANTIIPVPRKHRYLGVYGSKKYRRESLRRLSDYSLPYPKRAAEVSEATRDSSTVESEVQSFDAAYQQSGFYRGPECFYE